MTVDLQALLARAVALQTKTADVDDDLLAASSAPGVDPVADAEAAAEAAAEHAAADADAWDFGDDHAVADEEKAMPSAKCPECGSDDIDEFSDGTARCAECGTAIAAPAGMGHKGFDFDTLVDDEPEPEAEHKDFDAVDDGDGLVDTDISELVARRRALG